MLFRAIHLTRSNLTNPNRFLSRPFSAALTTSSTTATTTITTFQPNSQSSPSFSSPPLIPPNLQKTRHFSSNASNPSPPSGQPTMSTWSRGSESLSIDERRLIEINGESTVKFIQGLVTSDVDKMAKLFKVNPGGSGCWPGLPLLSLFTPPLSHC